MKYKVSFHGFHYVEANSLDEAEEKAIYENEAFYTETQVDDVEEIEEAIINLDCGLE